MGFGHGKFGGSPFGHSDLGLDIAVKSFSEALTEDAKGQPNELLLHYLYALQDSINRVRAKIEDVPAQVDVDAVRADLIQYLGSTINITTDEAEPIEFQRSLVGSAVQFYRIKGTYDSYRVRGKISGFDVEVFNMYRVAQIYVPLFSTDNLFELPAGSGTFYTDLPPGSVSGTPTELGCDYCQTTYIKLAFTVVKTQPPAVQGSPNFFDRLVYKLRDIIPIHVRDILYEIRAFILVDEHKNMAVPLLAKETAYTPASLWYHFDVTPADCVPCDFHGGITGTAEISP